MDCYIVHVQSACKLLVLRTYYKEVSGLEIFELTSPYFVHRCSSISASSEIMLLEVGFLERVQRTCTLFAPLISKASDFKSFEMTPRN